MLFVPSQIFIEHSIQVFKRIENLYLKCKEMTTMILKPHMKLHHLLQKCSFFLIKLAAFLASGAARVKLRQNGTVFSVIL